MPRKKIGNIEDRNKREDVEKTNNQSKRKSKAKEKYIDAEALLEEYLDEVVNGLSLSYLNLSREEYIELLKEPFVNAVGQVKTKPKSRTIINRLQSNQEALNEYFAMKLLMIKSIEKMTDEQLEFVVYNLKKGISSIVNVLYLELKKRNNDFLIEVLRNNWNIYGIRSPIKCPKCSFYAIMPDMNCKVCNYMMSERVLKEELNVIELLSDYMKLDPKGFNEILKSGHFYYSEGGVIPPTEYYDSRARESVYNLVFEIVLSNSEKKKLQELHNSRSIQTQ